MSEQTPYQQLRVSENATFEEIQESRNLLMQEYNGDRQKIEAIEAAYDAILMQRLKLRQEGKIKVPDRIRFAEKVAETPPAIPAVPKKKLRLGFRTFWIPQNNQIFYGRGASS